MLATHLQLLSPLLLHPLRTCCAVGRSQPPTAFQTASFLALPVTPPGSGGVDAHACAHACEGRGAGLGGGMGGEGRGARSDTKKEDQICISSLGKEHHDSLNTTLRTYLQKMCILCHSPEQKSFKVSPWPSQ